MKIIVFSDSHGEVDLMYAAAEDESPDMIIHLGDNVSDAERLRGVYPGAKLLAVAGNCDLASIESATLELELLGRRIFLTHGHTFGVKSSDGIIKLYEYASRGGADIVLFGHTHVPYHRYRDGILFANPGHIVKNAGGGSPTYGILNVYDKEGLDWKIVEAYDLS